jgi:PAS domain S-box-containing protein
MNPVLEGMESLPIELRLLQCALDASEQHVLITDRAGRIVFANRALAQGHGRARETLIGQSVSVILPAERNQAQIRKMTQAFRDATPIRVVVQGDHPSGSPLWLSLAITPIADAAGRARHFVGIATDITQGVEDARIKRELQARIVTQDEERERLSAELRLAQKLEAVGQLAAGVAHEINTPIQFVSDSVTFVGESLADLAAVIGAYRCGVAQGDEMAASLELDFLLSELPNAVERAKEGVGRVAGIVRAMREFSHTSDAHSSADVNRALETTLQVARSEYKHLATVDLRLGALPLVPCNIGELNQVFLNLIVNAAHAIEKSGKDVAIGKITVTTEQSGADLIISIEDNGCGISPEHRDKIFDPFFTTKEVGKGTGQGLSIARAIVVDRHRGAIEVDSVVGRGTRMSIRLPVVGS